MFLKRLIRRKNGKQHTYWALVESYRTAKGPRNRVVSYLGDLSPRERSGWSHFAGKLDGERIADPTLFEPPAAAESAARFERVRIKGVTVGRLRDFGDVYLALILWRLLGLDKLLAEAIAPGREEVPWGVVASILSTARFCEPSSELHIEDTWYRRTALPDLLGVKASQVHTDRLYAGLDALLPHKDAIEGHLRSRLGELFEIKYDLLLYDVTSTYFEGDAEANPMAKRGYSRDHRPDRPQVCIALVVSTEGMPLGYEVFDGNTQDSTTVKKIVEAIEKRHGKSQRVWVMDRGMVSEANLQWMREEDRKYIVGTPKAMLRRFEQHLVDKDWCEVREGVQVKLVPGADGRDTFILARSEDRRNKERAMHEKFSTAIEKQLEKLKKSVESGRLKDLAELNRKLGRLHERCWRAWGAFEIEAGQSSSGSGTAGEPSHAEKPRLSITWKRNARFDQWGDLAQGCYLLRTNLSETDPAVLWKHYIQLTEAEWAFRITKDELSIRPIWHHGAERTKAHILVCFLAYVMWKTMSQWMSRSGLGHAPRTLLEEMQKIKCADVTLPVREVGQTQERLLTLRCVTTPDESQQVLLNRLGLTLPRRLQYTEELVVASAPTPTQPMKM
jgi:transposase